MRVRDIVVGERRREDFGDIAGLAESIRRFGLLHPIVVDDDGTLVAGERRLRACIALGWNDIATTNLGLLSDAERQEIELEENLRRKDLTSYEQSRTLTALARTAAEVDRQQLVPESGTKSRGRPPVGGSDLRVSERIGVPRQTIQEAKTHVETAEAFPFMQAPSWKQYHVLQAKEQIERLPEPERVKAVAIIEESRVAPQAAIPILTNLASMAIEKRREVFTLAESDDPRDKSLALTTAAERPPMPDPRLNRIDRAMAELREAVKPFPLDPLTPCVEAVITELRAIARAIKSGGRLDVRQDDVA